MENIQSTSQKRGRQPSGSSPNRKLPRATSPEFLEKYIRTNSVDEEQFVKDFKMLKVRSQFTIVDLPAHPDALIGGIFNHCADKAEAAAHAHDLFPDRIAFSVNSKFLENPIYVPFKEIGKITMDSLLVLFWKVNIPRTLRGNRYLVTPFKWRLPSSSVQLYPGKERNCVEAVGRCFTRLLTKIS